MLSDDEEESGALSPADDTRERMLQQILNLTLQIIYLLTGVDIGKGREDSDHTYCQNPMKELSPVRKEQKILEITSEITQLLTGEVPIRCEDVAVYLSTEEREYLEEHFDLYKAAMMEDQPPLVSPDAYRKRYVSPQEDEEELRTTQQYQRDNLIVVKIEAIDDAKKLYDERCTQDEDAYRESDTGVCGVSIQSDEPETRITKNSNPPVSHIALHGPPIQSASATGESFFAQSTEKEHIPCDEHLANTSASNNTIHVSIKDEPLEYLPINPSVFTRHTPSASTTAEEKPMAHEKPLSRPIDSHNTQTPACIKEEPVERQGGEMFPHLSILRNNADKKSPSRPIDSHNMQTPACAKEKMYPHLSILLRSGLIPDEPDLPSVDHAQTPSSHSMEVPVAHPEIRTQAPNQIKSTDFSEMPPSSSLAPGVLQIGLDGTYSDFSPTAPDVKSLNHHLKCMANECLECGKIFQTKSKLARHELTHARLKSTICSKSFCGVAKSALHQQVHTGAGTFKCAECGNQFSDKASLTEHQKIHSGPFQCPWCSKRFHIYQNLVNHLKTHAGERGFQCSECGRLFEQQSQLFKHQKSHADKRPLKCHECGIGFSEVDELAGHRRTHSENLEKCTDCGKDFHSARELMQHERFHSFERTFSRMSNKNSPCANNDANLNAFRCTICGKGFTSTERLAIHREIHVRGRRYKCLQCGKGFFKEGALTAHQEMHKTQSTNSSESLVARETLESTRPSRPLPNAPSLALKASLECERGRPISRSGLDAPVAEELAVERPTPSEESTCTCAACQKKFRTKWSWLKHQKKHPKNRPYTCRRCDERFATSSDRLAHMKTHLSEKSFRCSKCGKGFLRRQNLLRHQSSHTADKTYVCPECGAIFYRKNALALHRRMHGGDECAECGKRFATESELSQHRQNYCGNRKHACSECGKRFTRNSILMRHMRTHTGEKPCSCSDCGRSFADWAALKRHSATHADNSQDRCADCGRCISKTSRLTGHVCPHLKERPHRCPACGKSYVKKTSLQHHQKSCQQV